MSALSFQSVSKTYAAKQAGAAAFRALDQVSFEVQEGEFFGLLGPGAASAQHRNNAFDLTSGFPYLLPALVHDYSFWLYSSLVFVIFPKGYVVGENK